MEDITYESLKIGTLYMVTLKSNSVITGILVSKIEGMAEGGGLLRKYKIGFGGTAFVDISEKEIEKITEIEEADQTEYFRELESKYGIKCFDDEEILSTTVILNNMLSKGIWNKLSQEEKEDFIRQSECNVKNVADIVDALLIYKEENEKLQANKLKILNATSTMLEQYNRARKRFANLEYAHDLFFKTFGVEKFIKEIC